MQGLKIEQQHLEQSFCKFVELEPEAVTMRCDEPSCVTAYRKRNPRAVRADSSWIEFPALPVWPFPVEAMLQNESEMIVKSEEDEAEHAAIARERVAVPAHGQVLEHDGRPRLGVDRPETPADARGAPGGGRW